jgi:hypothetical protein
MANTTFSGVVFSSMLETKRDLKNVFMRYANTEKEKLLTFGDSIPVQTAPTLTFSSSSITSPGASTFTTGTGPGGVISATDFVVTGETIVINKYFEYRSKITDFEVKQSKVSLEQMLAERFKVAYSDLMDAQIRDCILVQDVATIPAANKLYSGAPKSDVSKTTIYGYIEEMRVQLANQNVTENLVLFVSPTNFSRLIQSGLLDANDNGLDARISGRFRMLGGVKVVETPALTASFEMIMMEDKLVNFVEQINDTALTRATDGFYSNYMMTSVWATKLLTEAAKGVVIFYASA